MRRLLEIGYGLYALLAFLSVALALVLPVLLLPTLSLRRNMGRFAVRLGMALAFIRIRIRGLEHLPSGPCLVVSNHASYLDGPLMTAALPARFTFMVQHGAARWPIAGWIIRRMGVTFVNRGSARSGAAQTRGLIRRLAAGQSLVVFPEGTFEKTAGLLPFRNGAFLMAAHAAVPLVPGVIRGTRRIFGDDARLLRRGAVEIELFAPLAPSGDHRQAIQQLSDRARSVVLQHCGEPDRENPKNRVGVSFENRVGVSFGALDK